MRYNQGLDRSQATMFPAIMDEYITEDNPVRFLDAYIDTVDLSKFGFIHAEPKCTGRKPYNPADLLKLYIYGYLNHPRSGRKLERETHKNIEVIWLLRGLKPDFKTICDFRKDNRKGIKKVCREFILFCRELDLFSLELIGIDGSKFATVNHSKKAFTKAKLEKLVKEIDQSIDKYLEKIEQNDEKEKDINKPTVDQLKEKIKTLKKRKQTFQEYENELIKTGKKQIVITDPDSRIMRTGHRGQDVCYNVQIAVDEKYKLIAAFDITNEENDVHQLHNMANKVKNQFQLDSLQTVADLGYVEKNEIKKCHDDNIECFLPEDKKSQNNKLNLYTNKDFKYDPENDCYMCPAKQQLKGTRFRVKNGKKEKVYWTSACRQCKQKSKCTRSKDIRHIYRWEHEDIIDNMRERVQMHPEIIAARRNMVEHPFGTIKHSMGHHYFLCKGLEMVKTEISLSILAYNIKRVLNIIGAKELIQIVKMRMIKDNPLKKFSAPFIYYFRLNFRFLALQ